MSQPPCKHSQSVRHHDLIFFHDLHQVHHHFSHINGPHIRSTVFLHKSADILIKLAGIRFAFKLPKSQDCILDLADVVHGNPFNSFCDQLTIVLCKPSHHSHIDPDNLSILDPHVSRMWIRMEKAILHHLFDEIIHIFRSDLIKIITIGQKRSLVIDSKTVNIFHHKNMRRNILTVENRYFNESHIFVLFCKFRHICSFRQEIHLLLSHSPQFT